MSNPSENVIPPSEQLIQRAKRERYRREEAAARQEQKSQLAEEHDVVGHPKLDLLYEKSWSLGHAAGFHEVASYFSELVELIK